MEELPLHVPTLVNHLLERSAANPQLRASHRIDFGHERLRMTAIGFATGGELPEHKNPGEAALQVLRGRIRLTDALQSVELVEGSIVRVPSGAHRVEALEPSVMLLTAISLTPERND